MRNTSEQDREWSRPGNGSLLLPGPQLEGNSDANPDDAAEDNAAALVSGHVLHGEPEGESHGKPERQAHASAERCPWRRLHPFYHEEHAEEEEDKDEDREDEEEIHGS